MRSARTVSKVIRITLGLSAAATASAGNRTKRQSMQARRINEKGVCIVADSFFGTKARSRRSEGQKMIFAPICPARGPPWERKGLPEETSGVCEYVEKLVFGKLSIFF